MRMIVLLFVSLACGQAGELHQAARVCDAKSMRQLLAAKASLNQADENGMTPLHAAVESRQLPCVGLLLQAGADRQARDRQGRTPLETARQISDVRVRSDILLLFGYFAQQTDRDQTGPRPWSLEYSIAHGQTEVTKMLLQLGADPNAPGSRGTTPLGDAALKGDLESVRALLARGARPNAVSKEGTQAIHDAALGNGADVIRELVSKGTDVNARTRGEGQTPLHIAAAMGHLKSVEALIALGADLTLKDSKGQTPLQVAERAELTEVSALLKRATAAK